MSKPKFTSLCLQKKLLLLDIVGTTVQRVGLPALGLKYHPVVEMMQADESGPFPNSHHCP